MKEGNPFHFLTMGPSRVPRWCFESSLEQPKITSTALIQGQAWPAGIPEVTGQGRKTLTQVVAPKLNLGNVHRGFTAPPLQRLM